MPVRNVSGIRQAVLSSMNGNLKRCARANHNDDSGTKASVEEAHRKGLCISVSKGELGRRNAF
jgi:hypothetical protein